MMTSPAPLAGDPRATRSAPSPDENLGAILDTFARWARFADLFAYEERTETLTLQREPAPARPAGG